MPPGCPPERVRLRGSRVATWARARAYLVLELADTELLHLLHALPLLLLETRGSGRCDAAVSVAWENLKCARCWIDDGCGGSGERLSAVPSGAPPWRRRSTLRPLSNTTRGLFTRGAHPVSRRVVVGTPDAKVPRRYPGREVRSAEATLPVRNLPAAAPPPHTRRARSRPKRALAKWAASSGSSTRDSRPRTASPPPAPARASGRSPPPLGITQTPSGSRRRWP